MQHIVISCCHIYMMDHRDGRVIFSRGGIAIIISIPLIQHYKRSVPAWKG